MTAVGIIAEYNPFHNGHKYHLEKSLELTGADVAVAVMSGNFTQRGEPSCADKWTRAEMALKGGVDIVFELPFAYAVNSAEYFAKGAVRLLNGLGLIDFISFGSEEGCIERLSFTAGILADENAEFKSALKENLRTGISYPKARAKALSVFLDEKSAADDAQNDFLKSSNNILSIEYLKQLMRTNSAIKPITVKRTGGSNAEFLAQRLPDKIYTEQNKTNISSASAIRAALAENLNFTRIEPFVPESTIEILKSFDSDINLIFNKFYELVLYKIITSPPSAIAEILAVSEGIENRLIEAARMSSDMDTLVSSAVSKRYTETRMRRILAQLAIGLTKSDFEIIDGEGAMYGRVLGFSEKGARFLKEIKKSGKCKIPIITNVNKDRLEKETDRMLLSYDLIAADVYNLICGKVIYDYSDYVRMPYFQK